MANAIDVTPNAGLSTLHARLVEWIVARLRPNRVRAYPVILILGILAFLIWAEITALRAGLDISKTFGGDFSSFYTGGRLFLEGRVADLYDQPAQSALRANLIAPVMATDQRLHFVNPPFAVVLYAPFAWGGYSTGLLLWWCAGLLLLALSLYLLRQELLPASGLSIPRLTAISFLFYPTLIWFLHGQGSTMTLLVYTLTFVLLRRGRDFAAGAALGFLLYKPQLAIALGLVLLVKRRWRAVLGGMLSAGLWLAIGFAISPGAMQEYIHVGPGVLNFIDPTSGKLHPLMWGINTFYAFAVLLLGSLWPLGANIVGITLTVGGLIVAAAWWRRTAWQPGAYTWDLTLAATFALGLLITPYLYIYDLMLLLVPLVIVWSHHQPGAGVRHLDGGPLLAWTALLYGATFAGNYFAQAQLWLTASLGMPQVALQLSVPVIASWAWVVSRSAQEPNISPTPASSNG